MTAHIEEAAQLQLRSANQEQRLAKQLGGKEVAGIGELVSVSDDLPGARENRALLLFMHCGIDIIRSRD